MSPAQSQQLIEIRPSAGWRDLGLRELWEYRRLLYMLIWRDVKVRYRQTLLGAAWVMIQPLLTMLIFTFLLHRVAQLESGETPYALFVLSGLLPWQFVSSSISMSGNSLISNAHVLSKIYFPRLLIPMSASLVAIVDLVVNGFLVALMMLYYGAPPSVHIWAVVPLIALAFLLSFGVGLWLAALNVEYRDIRVLIPFLIQIWMYLTPVVYPLDELPAPYDRLALLNPATGIIEGFRAAILGRPLVVESIPISIGWTIVILLSGALYFRRAERKFADLI
ncbi:MAG: ABC transporter permease [Acidobacteria bacterium]|nr:ABC transporter permease [Acidobacteriota bacterium]